MDSEGIERITRDYSDEELRLCAVREANGLRPEGKYPTMGVYNGQVQQTAIELIRDAELIFAYLKDGTEGVIAVDKTRKAIREAQKQE